MGSRRIQVTRGRASQDRGRADPPPRTGPNPTLENDFEPESEAIEDQVIVITGASSGIGLATAERAASKGARVVLAARSADTIDKLAAQLEAAGGTAVAVPCDVADRAQVEEVARTAIVRFGRIDTWINNAGISIYGRLDEVSDEDNRRLFDTTSGVS
jgi:NADP-dependent 3-hydroxy acid dehydrogenase YdfG